MTPLVKVLRVPSEGNVDSKLVNLYSLSGCPLQVIRIPSKSSRIGHAELTSARGSLNNWVHIVLNLSRKNIAGRNFVFWPFWVSFLFPFARELFADRSLAKWVCDVSRIPHSFLVFVSPSLLHPHGPMVASKNHNLSGFVAGNLKTGRCFFWFPFESVPKCCPPPSKKKPQSHQDEFLLLHGQHPCPAALYEGRKAYMLSRGLVGCVYV